MAWGRTRRALGCAKAMEGEQVQRQHRVIMVSDFFYPNFGGVENHIYQLSQCLINLGLKVVVVTHAYGNCTGVRYLTNGLKVYYLPRLPFYQQATFPTLLGWARLLRAICVREGATLLHGHQAFSTMALEACINARSLGLKVVFTDHSLFGFADPGSIVLNKVLKAVLSDVHAVICVSHTSKENTVLRACLPPATVSVIPNAVDASQFQPNLSAAWPSDPVRDEIVLIVLCRLVYRKGVDLLSLVLPEVCNRHANVRVIVGGDGPKRQLLEKIISDHGLEDRVALEGPVPHERARDFMVRGHVFVNASLTEAFCMALVEAAAAGLVVVSTAVGGVPEVLPPDMVELAEPSAEGLLEAIERALLRVPYQKPAKQHERVRQMYDWNDVARRTVHVYNTVAASTRDDGLPARLHRYAAAGRWVGAFFGAVAVLSHLLMAFLDRWQPRHLIDIAPDWPNRACGAVDARPKTLPEQITKTDNVLRHIPRSLGTGVRNVGAHASEQSDMNRVAFTCVMTAVASPALMVEMPAGKAATATSGKRSNFGHMAEVRAESQARNKDEVLAEMEIQIAGRDGYPGIAAGDGTTAAGQVAAATSSGKGYLVGDGVARGFGEVLGIGGTARNSEQRKGK
ncbi:hypothetical protein VaNZ11_002990, partial [Volvox africanus]